MFNNTVTALNELESVLANIDLSGAPILCIFLAVCAFVCLEGFRIYKVVLYVAAFMFGFRTAHDYLWALIPDDDVLLMAEVACGLVLAVLAYKIYLAGVAIFVFQFARDNLEEFFDGPFAVIACVVAAALIAFLATKANRMVIVILTAVVGGFSMVNVFLKLIPVFPVDLSFFPPASSIVWYVAKIFLSAAGVMIQDVRDPNGSEGSFNP